MATVHINEARSDVVPIDDRSVLSPDVLDRIVAEVIRALDSRRASDGRREQDAQLWSSVRAGTGR
jgi:hypothetical protein